MFMGSHIANVLQSGHPVSHIPHAAFLHPAPCIPHPAFHAYFQSRISPPFFFKSRIPPSNKANLAFQPASKLSGALC